MNGSRFGFTGGGRTTSTRATTGVTAGGGGGGCGEEKICGEAGPAAAENLFADSAAVVGAAKEEFATTGVTGTTGALPAAAIADGLETAEAAAPGADATNICPRGTGAARAANTSGLTLTNRTPSNFCASSSAMVASNSPAYGSVMAPSTNPPRHRRDKIFRTTPATPRNPREGPAECGVYAACTSAHFGARDRHGPADVEANCRSRSLRTSESAAEFGCNGAEKSPARKPVCHKFFPVVNPTGQFGGPRGFRVARRVTAVGFRRACFSCCGSEGTNWNAGG